MRCSLLFILIAFLFFPACTSEEEIEIIEPGYFFELPREVIYSESFDSGAYSLTLDEENYFIINQVAYQQNGPYPIKDNGYLNIGCTEPMNIPLDSVWEKMYEVAYLDTVFHFRTLFNYKSSDFNGSSVGFQIDYYQGGITEFHAGKYRVTHDLPFSDLSGNTVHVLINKDSGAYEAYVNEENKTEHFLIEESSIESTHITFKVENILEFINGVPVVNKHGMRLDKIEVYSVQ